MRIMYKKIEGTEDYYITSKGRVYRKWKNSGFVELRTFRNAKGYFRVGIIKRGVNKQVFLHRLVAEAFIGNIGEGYSVNHIDGNKGNNNVENLEIITHQENMIHGCYVLNKLVKKVLKLDIDTLEVINSYPSITKAAENNDISEQLIGKVCLGKRKKAGGYTWCYASDYSEEFIAELRKRLEWNKSNRPVKQVDKVAGETLRIFDSIKEAKEITGISTVAHAVSGRTKSAGGYFWDYISKESGY